MFSIIKEQTDSQSGASCCIPTSNGGEFGLFCPCPSLGAPVLGYRTPGTHLLLSPVLGLQMHVHSTFMWVRDPSSSLQICAAKATLPQSSLEPSVSILTITYLGRTLESVSWRPRIPNIMHQSWTFWYNIHMSAMR